MKSLLLVGALASISVQSGLLLAESGQDSVESHFRCKDVSGGSGTAFRPYFLQALDGGTKLRDWSQTSKGLLGQNPMKTLEECENSVQAANTLYGVICSRTGLDGWKPTIYTGTTPGRTDFGYMGGSTIVTFGDCLTATGNSSAKGVCFWGGSDWYVSPIDRAGTIGGPYRTLVECTKFTKATDPNLETRTENL